MADTALTACSTSHHITSHHMGPDITSRGTPRTREPGDTGFGGNKLACTCLFTLSQIKNACAARDTLTGRKCRDNRSTRTHPAGHSVVSRISTPLKPSKLVADVSSSICISKRKYSQVLECSPDGSKHARAIKSLNVTKRQRRAYSRTLWS